MQHSVININKYVLIHGVHLTEICSKNQNAYESVKQLIRNKRNHMSK